MYEGQALLSVEVQNITTKQHLGTFLAHYIMVQGPLVTTFTEHSPTGTVRVGVLGNYVARTRNRPNDEGVMLFLAPADFADTWEEFQAQ